MGVVLVKWRAVSIANTVAYLVKGLMIALTGLPPVTLLYHSPPTSMEFNALA